MHDRLTGAQVADRHVLPGDAHAQPGTERLGTGLFRGPAFGIGARDVATAFGLALLDLGEDAVAEPVAEPRQRPFDPFDIRQVCAYPENHVSLMPEKAGN